MSQMDIDRVLATIRSFSHQGASGAAANSIGGLGGVGGGSSVHGTKPSGASEFANLIKQGLDSVNQTQQSADGLATAFEKGTPGVELPQVMLELQKASVSFRAVTEVRNRLVNAYQEIMNMPV
ncbi:MAG: flagellar hook-basal body complex protein FliE [Gammaproteobacteria bacterium]